MNPGALFYSGERGRTPGSKPLSSCEGEFQGLGPLPVPAAADESCPAPLDSLILCCGIPGSNSLSPGDGRGDAAADCWRALGLPVGPRMADPTNCWFF